MLLPKQNPDPRWYTKWTLWFAWRPVRLNKTTFVWLEVVERRDRNTRDHIVWEYRRLS